MAQNIREMRCPALIFDGAPRLCLVGCSLPSLYNDCRGEWETLNTPFKFNLELRQNLEKNFVNEETIQKWGEESCKQYFTAVEKYLCQTPCSTTVRINTLKADKSEIKLKLNNYLNEISPFSWQIDDFNELPDTLVITSKNTKFALTRQPKEVIVDLACGTAIMRGANVYAPGILSISADVKIDDEISIMADVEGKCLRGLLKPFLGKKVFVGNGKTVVSREQLFTVKDPRGLAVKITESIGNCPCLGSVFPDLIFLQNIPSIVCGHVLDPQPGELVLDMCAAPGGKSTHIAMLMKNKGRVIAIDKTQNKVNKIEMNARRFGLTNISCYTYNSCQLVDHSLEPKNLKDIGCPPYSAAIFDRILLDAPCSALGQRPQLINSMTLAQLNSYPPLQRKLLLEATALLKPGGILVYSTCTLTLDENEKMVKWMLNTFPDMKLDDQKIIIGEPGMLGAGLKEDELMKLQRFGLNEKWFSVQRDAVTSDDKCGEIGCISNKSDFTCIENRNSLKDTIGFFIAKFIKIS